MKRVVLFVMTNFAILIVLTVVTRLLGVDRYLTANGLDYGMLLGYAAVIGFAGAFISLLLSKTMAKASTGARVGIMNGFFPIPAVSVSVMRRSLPRVQFGDLAKGDNYQFDTDLKATNIRVAASLRFLLLDVAAGFGFDHYSSTGHIAYCSSPQPLCARQTVTVPVTNNRQVVFADAGLNLMVLKLIGEIGYQTGKDQKLSTTYRDFDPTAGHVYGGVGVRFSF